MPERPLSAPSREERIRLALNTTVLETLAPASGVMALIYLYFIFDHSRALSSWPLAIPLIALKSASVPILLFVRWAIARGRIRPAQAHVPSLLVGVVLLMNGAAHLFLSGEPQHTTDFVLLILAAGYNLLWTSWLFLFLLLVDGTWLAIRLPAAPSPEWSHYGYVLLVGTALSIALHAGRLRTQRRIEGLRLDIEAQAVELAVRKEEAERASRAKSLFLASMSHELRTPLNAILGFAQLMGREPARSDQDREHLDIINRSGEHLLALINDVLSLSKVEAGRAELHAAPFDLEALLRSVAEMVGLRAQAKGLRLTCETQGIVAAVRGDQGKIRQILVNLLGNAVKFTRDGSVVLRARWQDARATFEVADTGPGLTPEESAVLFGAFVQTRSGEESKEGTGLGLAISRNYARLLGGDLTFSSAPGRGSTFRFEVDLPQADAADVADVADDKRRAVSLAAGQRPPRVIVADDSRANRLLLSRLLARVGMSVREASNGRMALELWKSEPADILLLDLRMPELGGREVVAIIRSEEVGGRRVPIVAVTASAFASERESLVAAGFDDMILKPFRESEIFRIFARLLDIRFEWEEAAKAPAPRPLRAGSFEGFESAWIARFREALGDGDLDEALKLATEIERRDPALARDVNQHLRSFRFDEIDAVLGGRDPS